MVRAGNYKRDQSREKKLSIRKENIGTAILPDTPCAWRNGLLHSCPSRRRLLTEVKTNDILIGI